MIVPGKRDAERGDNSVALRRRFDRSKLRVCVKNVNLCALKIGLLQKEAVLSNELFKCRKKNENKVFWNKSTLKKKKQDTKNSPWKKKKRRRRRAKEHTTDCCTDQTLLVIACVCVTFPMYVCNDDDRCSSDSHQSSADVINLAPRPAAGRKSWIPRRQSRVAAAE